jgi:hypothetical protein
MYHICVWERFEKLTTFQFQNLTGGDLLGETWRKREGNIKTRSSWKN